MGRMASRESDERLLNWLARRCGGEPATKIARLEGVSQQTISAACNAVRKADEAAEGRSLDKEYW